MSHADRNNRRKFRGLSFALATLAFTVASGVSAQAQSGKAAHAAVDSRNDRAPYRAEASHRCLPANGAQIMGGFAGADDWLDPDTGEICHR